MIRSPRPRGFGAGLGCYSIVGRLRDLLTRSCPPFPRLLKDLGIYNIGLDPWKLEGPSSLLLM